MGKNRDKLSETLTDQQKEMLEKYDETINEMQSLAEQAAFQFGFSLVLKRCLMSRCLD